MSKRNKREHWEHLSEQYHRCIDGLNPLREHAKFSKAFGPQMSDDLKKEMTTLLSTVTADAKTIHGDINATAAMHQNSKGEFYRGVVPDTDGAQLKYLEINSRYIEIAERQTALLGDPMVTLADIRDRFIQDQQEEKA